MDSKLGSFLILRDAQREEGVRGVTGTLVFLLVAVILELRLSVLVVMVVAVVLLRLLRVRFCSCVAESRAISLPRERRGILGVPRVNKERIREIRGVGECWYRESDSRRRKSVRSEMPG